MKNNKTEKTFRIIFIILFILFISLFVSQKTGYYDYGTYKKTILTNEAIKKFEKDVKNGKNISLKNYVEEVEKDYGNNLSNTGLYFSKKIDQMVKLGVESIFTSIAKVVNK